jgi:hypothetical protein
VIGVLIPIPSSVLMATGVHGMGLLLSSDGSDADFSAFAPRPLVCSWAGLEGMVCTGRGAGGRAAAVVKERLTRLGTNQPNKLESREQRGKKRRWAGTRQWSRYLFIRWRVRDGLPCYPCYSPIVSVSAGSSGYVSFALGA